MTIKILSPLIIMIGIMCCCNDFGQASETLTAQVPIYDILTKIQEQAKNLNNNVRPVDVIEQFFLNFNLMFPELKDNFRISHSQSPQLQKVINTVIEEIYKLPVASSKSGFCAALPKDLIVYQQQLGISSTEIARNIYRTCLERGAIVSRNGSHIFEKKFVFVKISDPNFLLSGWTNNINTSYLFVKPQTTYGDLVLAIVHEMYISQDPKLFDGYLSLILRTLRRDKEQCTSIISSECSFEFDPDTDNNKLLLMTHLPEIAYTFASMRAYEVERKVLSEMLNQDIERPDLKTEFLNIFKQLPNLIERSGRMSLLDHNNSLIQAAKKRNPNLASTIEYIFNNADNFTLPDDSELNFILYMATPEFSIYSFEKVTATGPGCTYCGGAYAPDIKQKWDQHWLQSFSGELK